MRVTAPVTDYIRASRMSTQGDLVVRGALVPERLPAGADNTYLQGKGAGVIPAYDNQMPPLTTQGDLLTRGAVNPERIPAGTAGHYLQGTGAGSIPGYTVQMPPLTTTGDLLLRGAAVPERLAAPDAGYVLRSSGVGSKPYWSTLFNLLTTKGDIWIRGTISRERLAAGLLDTYFKGQGAGELPIYEKLALRDTGTFIDNDIRAAAGNEVITGVGFQPSVVIFLAVSNDADMVTFSVGYDDGTTHMCIYQSHDGTKMALNNTKGIAITIDGSNFMTGYISALSSDGYTITWALTGACTVHYSCLALP